MSLYPSFIDLRSHLASEFSRLRTRARREALWAKLIGKNTQLSRFPKGTHQQGLNRTAAGLQDVCLEEIIGTLYRHYDFDAQFRPLKKNLRDRWINIYLLYQREGWPPIVAHRVGNGYYIEDGHHRVSVARSLGLTFIQAQVWDYPDQRQPARDCSSVECPETTFLKELAPATD